LVRDGGAGGEVDLLRKGGHGSEAKPNQTTHNIKARLSRRMTYTVGKREGGYYQIYKDSKSNDNQALGRLCIEAWMKWTRMALH
jgi:hypothetical protein